MIKTEYLDEYLMKRFGGFEFLSRDNIKTINLLDEDFINRITELMTQSNQSASNINATKIVSLFQINPSQASVNTFDLHYKIKITRHEKVAVA